MSDFLFEKTGIPGAFVISSPYVEDNRGSFCKCFERNSYMEQGAPFSCDEDFLIVSEKNVIRGMHFQLRNPQIKLVSVAVGKIYGVIVDLREESPAFGVWMGCYLSERNRKSLYVPRGCAFGSLGLHSSNVIQCRCDGEYDAETDSGILYCDPDIGIEWPVLDTEQVIVAPKDQSRMTFQDFKRGCKFDYQSDVAH